jgi:hypothetical protein
MNKQGILIGSGGLVMAAAAHVLFFCGLMVAQPQPGLYLARFDVAPAAATQAAEPHCDSCAVAAGLPGPHPIRI